MSDDAAAELASAGVATETATKMPRAEAAFRISDWHEAKALDTILCNYPMLRPAPFLAQPRNLTETVDLSTRCDEGGVRWIK